MALNPNMTTSAGISPAQQKYYDKKMIKDMKPKLVHYQYGQVRPIPKRGGKTVQFRKWTPFGALTTPLQEGVVPNGQALSMTEITATVDHYGGYVTVTDMLDLTALDPIVNDSVEMMADQGALTIDKLTQTAMAAGTNVQYANGKTTRVSLTVSDKLTTTEIRRAVRTLKKAKAPMFSRGGRQHYIAIVGPDAVYSMQEDSTWMDVSKYQDKESIYSGEIGQIMGVVFVESTEALIYTGAGASGINVLGVFVFGRDAYGVIDIDGGANVSTKVKSAGSAGTADPLDQISTIGWKVQAYVAKILQPGWLVRIECGAQA